MTYHPLLERQLRRLYGDRRSDWPAELSALLDLIDASYRDFEGERVQLERSLVLSSEELGAADSELGAVFEELPDLFIWFDERGEVVRVEPGRPETRYPGPEELGREPAFAAARRRTHERRAAEVIELSISRPGAVAARSDRQHYEARFVPLLGDEVLAVVRNITERLDGELDLAAEKERLVITLASIGDGVLTTDGSGRIELINRAAERLIGVTAKEVIGEPLEAVVILETGDGPSFGEHIERVVAEGTEWTMNEAMLQSRVAVAHTVDVRAAPIEDGRGVVLVIRDVGERVRLIEERLRASKLESLAILAGGIAHDFNNILQALLGSISLAEFRIGRGRNVTSLLAKARRAALRARDLTKQLLAVSRGGAPVKKSSSVRELLIESSTFAARGTKLRCVFAIAEDLAPVEIDAGQISQVIHNLVINASQAMPDGGVVEIGAENCDGEVRLWVRDDGYGIPRDTLPKIYDPYFTTKEGGSGLGLYTAYVIVRRHDGHIEVESEAGAGTTFSIYLPIASRPPDDPERQPPVIAGGRGRVLVMDDQDEVLTITRQMLQHLGYTVDIAHEGREATELFLAAAADNGAEGGAFDVALLDLTVPGGQGGVETLGELRRSGTDFVAVAMTGYANDEIVESYELHGFDSVLVKPFSVVELDRVMRAVRSDD